MSEDEDELEEEEDMVPGEVDEEDKLSFLEAQECLRKLKANAPKLGVPANACIHLDRFLKALRGAHAQKPKKDGTLHSHFKSVKKAKKWDGKLMKLEGCSWAGVNLMSQIRTVILNKYMLLKTIYPLDNNIESH